MGVNFSFACLSLASADSFACSSSAYGCQFFLPMLEFGFELLSGLGGSCHQILWLNFFLTFKDTHKCLSHSKPSTASERLYSHSLYHSSASPCSQFDWTLQTISPRRNNVTQKRGVYTPGTPEKCLLHNSLKGCSSMSFCFLLLSSTHPAICSDVNCEEGLTPKDPHSVSMNVCI